VDCVILVAHDYSEYRSRPETFFVRSFLDVLDFVCFFRNKHFFVATATSRPSAHFPCCVRGVIRLLEERQRDR
jgi:hypothetical protein